MTDFPLPPPDAVLQNVIDEIKPGHRLTAVSAAPGGFSNATHFLETISPENEALRLVLRQYNPENEPPARKAPREFAALELLSHTQVPSPQPLFLDAAGDRLGAPGILTAYVPGKPWVGTDSPLQWARALAEMLARIHAVPLPSELEPFMDGNPNTAWFALRDVMPDFMAPHPDAQPLYRAAREFWPRLTPVSPVLVHIDFWAGNLLWQDGRISGVLDWEEAGWGDPGIDVAYSRLELTLLGLPDAAAELLAHYERLSGHTVQDLPFWDLVAAVRAMPDPAGWWDEWTALGAIGSDAQTIRDSLRQFIQAALGRMKEQSG